MKPTVVYSPLGVRRMEQYRKRLQLLVNEGRLTPREAAILNAAEMRRITDRIRGV